MANIYQLKPTVDREILLMEVGTMNLNTEFLIPDNYLKIWEGEVSNEDVHGIYNTYNKRITPPKFAGQELAVGDIIEINNSCYMADYIYFKAVKMDTQQVQEHPDFIKCLETGNSLQGNDEMSESVQSMDSQSM